MSVQETKNLINRLYEEIFNQGNIAVVDEIIAADYHSHEPEGTHGLAEFKQEVPAFRAAFPDLEFTLEEIVVSGDRVCHRWTARGTHEGELMGVPPTGREVTLTGTTIERIEDGKIAESWPMMDRMGLMQQLGVIPG